MCVRKESVLYAYARIVCVCTLKHTWGAREAASEYGGGCSASEYGGGCIR